MVSRFTLLVVSAASLMTVACDSDSDPVPTVAPDSGQSVDIGVDTVAPTDVADGPDIADVAELGDGDDGIDVLTDPDVPDTASEPDPGFVIPEHEFGVGVERPRLEKVPASGPLRAGAAVVWMEAPVGVSFGGFAGRGGRESHWAGFLKASGGFYGRSNTKALVLEVDGERVAFIKSPLVFAESWLTYATLAALKKDHGIDLEGRLVMSAGHSHHEAGRFWPVPGSIGILGSDTFDAEVASRLAAQFAEVVAAAVDDLGPAEWAYTSLENWDPNNEVYRDRRGVNNAKYGKDPRVTLLGVRRPEGAPVAFMVNFPIHGIVFDLPNDLLTEDAPGYVERKIEEHFFETYGEPVFGLFMQSAGGDASPAGDSLKHPKLARLERIGHLAARPIVAAWSTLEWRATADLAVRSRLLELKYDRLYEGTELDGEFENAKGPYTWGGLQCYAVGVTDGETLEGEPKECARVEDLLGSFGGDVPHSEVHQAYLTVVQLSDLVMMTIPGEPTWSITKYAREQMEARTWNGEPVFSMVLGYSQDHLLYFTSPDDWFFGEFEAQLSFWGPAGGRWLVDRNLELIDDILEGFGAPTYYAETDYLAEFPEYEPRAQEVSTSAGVLHQGPETVYTRGESVVLRFGAGDPSIRSPKVILERAVDGGFEAVPAPNGWLESAYGNDHYGFITVYQPTPDMGPESVATRAHDWRVIWQVPADFALGTYRFRIAGEARLDTGLEPYLIETPTFEVGASPDTALLVEPSTDGAGLVVAMTTPGGPEVPSDDGSWPQARYRLVDPAVKHDALVQRVPTALRVVVKDGETTVFGPETLPWSDAARGSVVHMDLGLLGGPLTVQAVPAADGPAVPPLEALVSP